MSKTASLERKTNETDINLKLNLYGNGKGEISTGIGFFDHMLDLFKVHGGFNITLNVKGDLQVDTHHTIEDTGIVLGLAIKELLGDKAGIKRYGSFYVPMDESLAFVSLDISGRPFLVCDVPITAEKIGDFETEMLEEFFRAFAFNAGITLHIKVLYGTNNHHMVEAVFKALARALKEAIALTGSKEIPSSKGVL
jgi:imidazoleglycerol-phosphate dehydratase